MHDGTMFLTKPRFGGIIKNSESPHLCRPPQTRPRFSRLPESSFPQATEIGDMRTPLIASVLVWVVALVAPAIASPGDEPTSAEEKLLESKGLTRNDRKFLLDEKAAIEKYEAIKPLFEDYQKAMYKYATIVQYDETLMSMMMEQQGIQQQANALQMQINSMPRAAGRMARYANAQTAPLRQQQSQIRSMASQYTNQINAFKRQAPKADDRKTVPAQVERTRQVYVEAVRELSALVTPLTEKYHELALDKSVIDALEKLRRRDTKNYKLGPSDELSAAAKVVQNVKKQTSGGAKSKKKSRTKTSAKTP